MPSRKVQSWRIVLAVAAAMGCTVSAQDMAAGEEVSADLAARLTPAQRKIYDAYHAARSQFDRQFRAYWRSVDAKRELRRAKHIMGQGYTADDYVAASSRRNTQGPSCRPISPGSSRK